MNIKSRPCAMYESYVADAESSDFDIEVRRDGLDSVTKVRVSNRCREIAVTFVLNDDELDTLATMLRDAYNSQEREE